MSFPTFVQKIANAFWNGNEKVWFQSLNCLIQKGVKKKFSVSATSFPLFVDLDTNQNRENQIYHAPSTPTAQEWMPAWLSQPPVE